MWPVEGGKTPRCLQFQWDVQDSGYLDLFTSWRMQFRPKGRRVPTSLLQRGNEVESKFTPPKTNSEFSPENWWLGILLSFLGVCLLSGKKCCSFQGGWTKTTQQNYNQSSEYTVKLGFMNVIQRSVIQIYPNLRPFVISDQNKNQLRLRALEGSSPRDGDVLFPPNGSG